MKTIVFRSTLALMGVLMLAACASKGPVQPILEFSIPDFSQENYTSKVDNFLVILDASSSMAETYNGNEKFVYAKEIAHRLNQSLPELGQNSGLRSFGHSDSITKKPTLLLYGMEDYSTQAFKAALETLHPAGGPTPLYKALDAARTDLDGVVTKTAVIIITDGKDLAPDTVAYATALKEQLGSSLCIYPILVGDDARGAEVMDEIAAAGNCGFTSNADDLLQGNGMADFVEKIFLTRKSVDSAAMADSDGDGVPDYLDKCPGTPAGTTVNAAGCPLDTDSDGVSDDQDQDSSTPLGASVNAQGLWVVKGLLFDFDKSIIKPSSFPELNKVAGILKQNPGLKVELQGHADIIGTPEYNYTLSMKRAKAVQAYLINKGVAPDSIFSCSGYGFTKPVASNATAVGRSLNRRVEIHPVK